MPQQPPNFEKSPNFLYRWHQGRVTKTSQAEKGTGTKKPGLFTTKHAKYTKAFLFVFFVCFVVLLLTFFANSCGEVRWNMENCACRFVPTFVECAMSSQSWSYYLLLA